MIIIKCCGPNWAHVGPWHCTPQVRAWLQDQTAEHRHVRKANPWGSLKHQIGLLCETISLASVTIHFVWNGRFFSLPWSLWCRCQGRCCRTHCLSSQCDFPAGDVNVRAHAHWPDVVNDVYVCAHAACHACSHTCVCVCVYVCMDMCMFVCMYVRIRVYMYSQMYLYACRSIDVYVAVQM